MLPRIKINTPRLINLPLNVDVHLGVISHRGCFGGIASHSVVDPGVVAICDVVEVLNDVGLDDEVLVWLELFRELELFLINKLLLSIVTLLFVYLNPLDLDYCSLGVCLLLIEG